MNLSILCGLLLFAIGAFTSGSFSVPLLKIPVMDIYLIDNRMVMLCEIAIESDFDEAWNSMREFKRKDEGNINVMNFWNQLFRDLFAIKL